MIDCFSKMDGMAMEGQAFLFILDFELQKPLIFPLKDLDPGQLLFDLNGKRNYSLQDTLPQKDLALQINPISTEIYTEKFNRVQSDISKGNSYLLNLTFETPIEINYSLKEIFLHSKALAKLIYKNEFVVFSPEKFVSIKGDTISAYPMKGTIDANIPDAENTILSDKKESAEHATITDLLRNDLSLVAENVTVSRYRYIDKINTGPKQILQVSSEINGKIMDNYLGKPGSILKQLLPAGSVTGAPKRKTVEIIKDVEGNTRGYYTGIFGFFDGTDLESAVMIRFIENRNGKFFFRSGGGITFQSDAEMEYNEYIDKIYVPLY